MTRRGFLKVAAAVTLTVVAASVTIPPISDEGSEPESEQEPPHMNYSYVLVSKRTYPHETLHIDTCGAVSRASYPQYLSKEQVGRLDLRHDKCNRCMPRVLDADGIPDGYHPAHLEFLRIQNEYWTQQATDSQRRRLVRQRVALELALAKVEAELREFGNTDDLYVEAFRTMAAGTYTPDELDVTVGRAYITKRPSSR